MKNRHSCILLVGALLFVCAVLVQGISAAEADEFKRLQDMAVVAQKAPAAEQASRWKDFLSQSSSFASKNPTMDIWLLRAVAAIAANDETAGKEAAAKLVGLGALGSKDELLRNLMANLVLRGWVFLPAAYLPDKAQTALQTQVAMAQDKFHNKLNDDFKTLFPDKSTSELSTQPSPSAASKATLEARALDLAVEAAGAAPTERSIKWDRFLDSTAQLAASTDNSQFWLWRATAALELQREKDAKEAGAKLRSLGALDSQVPAVRKVVAALVLRGWFPPAGGTVNSASAATKHATVKTEADVVDFVEAWRGRWESKDVDSYAELYSEDYVSLGGSLAKGLTIQKKPEVISQRKKYADSADSISVTVSNIKAVQTGACWKATFTQGYKRNGSSHYGATGTKTLRLKPGGPLGFLIFAEEYNEETKLKPHNSESQQNTAPFKNQSPSRVTPKPFTSASDVLF